jgi:hypothetical protein
MRIFRVAARAAALTSAGVLLAAVSLPAHADRSAFVSGSLPTPYAHATNVSLEPASATAPDGTVWAASNFLLPPCERTVSGCGTDVWKSRDGGRHWSYAGNPFIGMAGNKGAGFGGYDVDVAVAPERNTLGHYNVYVASLWSGSNSLAVSQDDGESWQLMPVASAPGTLAAPLPASAYADRPWVGADGPCTAYVASNFLPGNVTTLQRFDGCNAAITPGPAGLPFAPLDTNVTAGTGKVSGRFAVDGSATSPFRHRLYYPAVTSLGGQRSVVLSVSTDNGQTWSLRKVAPYPSSKGIVWPVTVAVDAAGTVYAAWHDATSSWIAASRDGASTWSTPTKLNEPGTTAIYPTVAAARPGQVVVAWYGADREGPADSKGTMGKPYAADGAIWRLVVSRSHDGGAHWTTPQAATGPVARGMVCVSGGGCSSTPGSRQIYDCFGVTLDAQGRFSAVFTNALPRTSPTDPNHAHSEYVADR